MQSWCNEAQSGKSADGHFGLASIILLCQCNFMPKRSTKLHRVSSGFVHAEKW